MEDLDDKIEKNAKEGAAELKQQWRSLSDERSALELQIDRLGDATEDGWDKGRDAVGESMSKIRREMNELKRKIG
ncbi:MAG: hypothetical protein U5J83_13125 [Bryobacterales bacterium]|nr:hypothetical protein [Bryobacterales bacterium]